MKVRSCGACDACCMVLGVRPLDKPAYQRCGHQAQGGGCGIYADRPHTCQIYRCAWLEGLGKRRDRPDRLGVILDTLAPPLEVQKRAAAGDEEAKSVVDQARRTVRAREVRPRALAQPRVKAYLEQLHRAGRVVVMIPFRGRRMPVGRPL